MSSPRRKPRRRLAPYSGHCGMNDRVRQLVPVEPVREEVPDVGALTLCGGCRTRDYRTWRLRWRQLVEAGS